MEIREIESLGIGMSCIGGCMCITHSFVNTLCLLIATPFDLRTCFSSMDEYN